MNKKHSKKYRVTFECYVEVEANDKEQDVQRAWLQKNIDKGSYKFMNVVEKTEPVVDVYPNVISVHKNCVPDGYVFAGALDNTGKCDICRNKTGELLYEFKKEDSEMIVIQVKDDEKK